ncbi:MAG TPA: ABC-F family ATP-binding cassette domain-containing protein [Candidatus Limisoma intestinavium]|uniref:ABC-F family ATP-binding cassette domain-containing protein n=1 Tax=Candidatus Limisoma intestinavium TaxID=2840856 RepID=A0A9D1IIS7_9BACT|nr:ABC-F family ATP-binding cassette domain-containing protein [Candidatus Limisoma intestinavium]
MKSFLQVENLSKSFGDKVLFSDVTFGIYEGDKIGLIAKNGAGKTTLLRIVAGAEAYDSGEVTYRNGLRVAYLAQLPELDGQLPVADACMSLGGEAVEAVREYEAATASGDSARLERAMQRMDASGGWTYEDRMRQVLTQLKISDLSQRVGELSGGQQKRVALAKVILDEPELLILDEPTNHLDIDMIEWLEDYLSRSRVALLMVTHDRYFLDKVCSKILEIDERKIYAYEGNYDYYLAKREERISAQNAELLRVKNLLRTELEWMRRQPQARGTKAKYRIDAFYALDAKSKERRNDSSVRLKGGASYIGSKIFEAIDVSKRYGDKVILRNFEYVFARYEKVGIVGGNGVGKSTFVKLLLGLEQPDSGRFDVGETVKFGYYSQEGIRFDEQEKVIDAVRKIAEVVVIDEKTRYTASQFLQFFLFPPAAQQNYIYKLSGGEKRRLYLATVLMKTPNFLILDEPTNDLDITTLGILEEYIAKFKGCVIVVSHDRFFLDRTVDHLFVFEGDGIVRDFPGSYSDYRSWRQERDAEKANAEAEKKSSAANSWKPRREKSDKMTFKERKEFESLAGEIADLEKEKREIEEMLNSGNLGVEELTQKSQRISEVLSLLDEKEMRWLELSEKQ